MNPNSLNNLITAKDRTRQQLSEMGRKGGIASGKAKRENKTTITLKLETYSEMGDETYIVKAGSPEAAARGMAALQDELHSNFMRRLYGDDYPSC